MKTLAGLFAATLMGPWVVALNADDGHRTTLRMFQHQSAARQKAFVFVLQDTVTDHTTFSQLAPKTTSTDTEKQLIEEVQNSTIHNLLICCTVGFRIFCQ